MSFLEISQLGPPREIHEVVDAASGLRAWVVLDDESLGPCFGGTRFRSYRREKEALDEAIELARHMTWKCAFAGLPAGGGKAVVDTSRLRDRRTACRVLGDFVESLQGRFRTAGDLGATPRDIADLGARTRYVVEVEDLDFLADATARGLVACADAARAVASVPESPSALVQGVGAIGRAAARAFAERGYRVLVSDLEEERARRVAREVGGGVVDPCEVAERAATVWAPCATGGVIDEHTAGRLRCRIVAPGANCAVRSLAAADLLVRRGILSIPDFAANAGAVIFGVHDALHGRHPGPRVFEEMADRAARVLEEAVSRSVAPERIAVRRAEEAVLAARRR